jgi:CheY-like chemotaxis protein
MRKKILVVEDDEASRSLVTDVLRHVGYQVLQAENGLQALEMTEKHHPDLILLDIRMPVMDGFECIKKLRANVETDKIKIIAITASVMIEEKDLILATGVEKYLSKPIDICSLPKLVKKMIG